MKISSLTWHLKSLYQRAPYLVRLHPVAFYPAAERLYLVNEERRFILASIPKVASASLTVWFLNTLSEYGVTSGSHSYAAKRYSIGRYNSKKAWQIWNSFYKFAFVRSPWTRLSSAFLWHFVPIKSDKNRRRRFAEVTRPVVDAVYTSRGKMPDYKVSISFKEFVEYVCSVYVDGILNIHWRPQSWFIHPKNFDFVGRLEKFEPDFARVLDDIGIDKELSWRNKSSDKQLISSPNGKFHNVPAGELLTMNTLPAHMELYDPQLYNIVAKRYQKDVELFGYNGQKNWASLVG